MCTYEDAEERESGLQTCPKSLRCQVMWSFPANFLSLPTLPLCKPQLTAYRLWLLSLLCSNSMDLALLTFLHLKFFPLPSLSLLFLLFLLSRCWQLIGPWPVTSSYLLPHVRISAKRTHSDGFENSDTMTPAQQPIPWILCIEDSTCNKLLHVLRILASVPLLKHVIFFGLWSILPPPPEMIDSFKW